MVSLNLIDHAYVGCQFTWSNKRLEDFPSQKLDRVLVNEHWLHKGLGSSVEFLPPGFSDHSAALLDITQVENAEPKPFKFFNFWTSRSGFHRLVEKVWAEEFEGMGKRGVRQGDPLSPYLFVIAMDVLTQLLNGAASRGLFGYHPHCKSVGLTHLFFADDLFIFLNGTESSLFAVLEVLHGFYKLSGLRFNLEKSKLFCGGLQACDHDDLLRITDLKKGFLLGRYLGLPLISSKLTSRDYNALAERIVKRIKSWTTKYLSYAGRVQLITSVIFSMVTYRCSSFILPKRVIKLVHQKMSIIFVERI